MKKIFCVILCSFFAINLSAKELTPKRTVVAGRVINTTSEDPNMLFVHFCDMLNDDYVGGTKLDEDGGFHAEYEMYLSQNMTIKYNNNFISLFVNPSDSIYLEIDISKFRNNDFDGLKFSGSGADLNNQFAKFDEHISSFALCEIDPNLPPKEYMVRVKESAKNKQDSLSAYIKENNLPPFFEEWARRDIIFSIANYNLTEYAPDSAVNRLEVFTDSFFDIYDEDNFQTMMFPYHLDYLIFTMLESDEKGKEYLEKGDYEKAALVGLKLLSKLPISLSRDFMTCTLIQYLSINSPGLYEKLPKNLFTDPFFDNVLNKSNLSQTTFQETPIKCISFVGKDNQVTPLEEQDFLKYLTSTYEGKIIYVDIYATWCGPCRKEFPYAKELHKLYKEDVVFVNLCLGSQYERWLPTVAEFEIEGENYFFDSDATDLFRTTYQIGMYPTYLIIGKNGEVVTMNAPRPSDLSKLKIVIDSLK